MTNTAQHIRDLLQSPHEEDDWDDTPYAARPADPGLRGLLDEDSADSIDVALWVLLVYSLDDSRDVEERHIFDDAARWAATTVHSEAMVTELLALLDVSLRDLDHERPMSDADLIATARSYRWDLSPEVSQTVIDYVHDPSNDGRDALQPEPTLVMAIAVLAMTALAIRDDEERLFEYGSIEAELIQQLIDRADPARHAGWRLRRNLAR